MSKKSLSAVKAKKILKDGYVKGKPLTAKQRKYFGAIASGATPLKKINGSGGVPKAQDGTVKYGTPEYKKAYDEGTFADVPNQLDEVVMYSGVDYERYPYYNDLSAEQRKYFNDPGAIGRGVRRAAYTKRGLAEDTYDVVNPIMYGMLGLAGGMMAGPSIATLGRAAAPYVSRYALNPIQKALSYKPLGGPVSIGNTIDAGSAAYATYATPEAYNKFKENPNWDTGTDLGLTAIDLVPFGEIFTGGKNIRKAYNYTSDQFSNIFKAKPKGINLETTPLRDAFTQPNMWPTSSPLPKNMEPYLSRKTYPFNKEQEIFESFLSTDTQLKNIDSKSLYYDPAGKSITKGEADKMKHGGWLSKYENGGVIKDDMGQWAHPGEVTEISGNTMATHGYGDNPLYVVPDVGEPRVVEANTGTQTFPGATKFTEYPMAKNGSSLVELNQLTNFTNYNTPQPEGWLDKYN